MYGGCVRPILGGTQTQRGCFAYIYKAILLAKNSGHSGYFAKNDLLHDSEDSRYFARCAGKNHPREPGSLRPTFSPSIQ